MIGRRRLRHVETGDGATGWWNDGGGREAGEERDCPKEENPNVGLDRWHCEGTLYNRLSRRLPYPLLHLTLSAALRCPLDR